MAAFGSSGDPGLRESCQSKRASLRSVHWQRFRFSSRSVSFGSASFGSVSFGPVSFGPVSFGPVSFGPVSFGPVSLVGLVGLGKA